VVTTPYSFVATAEAIVRLGARPVFADVEADTLNLDERAAETKIGPRTKAVLVVHLFGRLARTARLEEVCRRAGLPLIEDGAQAIGAWRDDGAKRSKLAGLGAAATLSFFPTKNLGGFGDGGMVLTDEDVVADKARLLRNHGAEDKLRHVVVGGNFRLDELQAALLRVKLSHLAAWTARRRAIAGEYRLRLSGLPIDLPPDDPGCVWNQFVIRVPGTRRDELARHLAAQGVATAIYYPLPLHLQPMLSSLGYVPGAFPQAERAARETLALPIYPELADASVARVAAAVAEALG
jgi:dTDP-4-amino-4,6-dideoxygalactose transaminase